MALIVIHSNLVEFVRQFFLENLQFECLYYHKNNYKFNAGSKLNDLSSLDMGFVRIALLTSSVYSPLNALTSIINS
jgi:uncharacterized membrane protein